MAVLALIVPLGSPGGPVDPGFGVPAPPAGGGAPVYPSHPIALPPVYPSQGLPPVWGGGGQPVYPSQGLPVYPSHQPIPPPPLGIWGPGQMPPGIWPSPPSGGSGGEGGSAPG